MGDKQMTPAPFATVAIAGHATSGGRYCNCNDPSSCTSSQSVTTSPTDELTTNDVDANQSDLTTGLGITLLLLMYWLTDRAY